MNKTTNRGFPLLMALVLFLASCTNPFFAALLGNDEKTGGAAGDPAGSLVYHISFPADVRGVFALYPKDAAGESREIDISPYAGGTASGTILDLPAGSYGALIALYDAVNNTAAEWSGELSIYADRSSSLTRDFTGADFTACPPLAGQGKTSLAAKFDAALDPGDSPCTIVLDGTETDLASFSPKDLNATAAKEIIIRGGGYTVQLGGTGSPLLTLGDGSGSNLVLELHDITLKGLDSNTAALIRVSADGSLTLKAGSLITGNTAASSSSGSPVYGGGVHVEGGTFTMSGGAVSGNTASTSGSNANGGGVYVDANGTFTMSGGSVSGNTATTSTHVALGGGVYVDANGNFTMSGGSVSGNTASGPVYGGGVHVKGTFTMSGGSVSGNTASSSAYVFGCGVSVHSGTFIMSGGSVSGNNTTSHSVSGGGVYVSSGTFIMYGGSVSGNTFSFSDSFASVYGGGVYVADPGATFTMSGGAVSGNTFSFSDSPVSVYGGGVYVSNGGIFTMNDGAVSDNTASFSDVASKVYGGGVCVNSAGTFTMNGGAVSDNTASFSSPTFLNPSTANGGGVYVKGTFTMSGGSVSGNTASFSSSSPSTADGGGVYVETSGTFTMSGGAVSGNTISFSSASHSLTAAKGGGVYVGGTFTMSGGAVSGNTSTAAAGRSFGREVLVNGSFKISGDAQPERIFLYKDDWYITISGDLSGPVIPIDLGIENSKPLSAWEGKQILQLDGAYSGTLAGLKSHFSLGNAKRTDSLPYTEAAVTGYVIADDGEVAAE